MEPVAYCGGELDGTAPWPVGYDGGWDTYGFCYVRGCGDYAEEEAAQTSDLSRRRIKGGEVFL